VRIDVTVSSHATSTRTTRNRRNPRLRLARTVPSPQQGERGRRALNVLVAAVAIVLTAPLMAAIVVLIRLTSRGPVLYRQTRVGLDRREDGSHPFDARRRRNVGGRPFTIYKFRTMRVNTSDEVWAQPDDPRITRVGKFLRSFRLDELPQLFNVLRGDMNIVGPRPEQPKIFAALRDQIEHYPERQRVRPGITGWAQINQHYDRSIADVRRKVELDLEYVQRQSFLEDLSIMARTIPVMIFQRGAW
jgi:lipopolysaccharide/colanic/teichoic acid biosynthesis glycosyltransferase